MDERGAGSSDGAEPGAEGVGTTRGEVVVPAARESSVVENHGHDSRDPQQEELAALVRVENRLTVHAGPLPQAADLYAYEQVHAGLADRIVKMAEHEQLHRHALEHQELLQPYKLASRGQVFGFLAVLGVLAFAGVMAVSGYPGWATLVSGLDLIGLAAVFVGGRVIARKSDKGQEADESEFDGDEPDDEG